MNEDLKELLEVVRGLKADMIEVRDSLENITDILQ